MLFKSALMTTGSGKIKGIVASHNKGGQYFRGLTIPTNPRTARQTVVRNAMGTLSTAWVQTLTATQRAGWQAYADNISWTNALGDSIQLSGLNAYMACNAPRLQNSVARVDTAPVVFDRGSFTLPVATITAASATASIAFTNSDPWAIEVGGYLFVYASKPQNPSISSYSGPYQLLGKVTGAVSPPSSPASMTMPQLAGPSGSKVFFRFTTSRADGRLSPTFRSTSTA
jgi:hypothetical protein